MGRLVIFVTGDICLSRAFISSCGTALWVALDSGDKKSSWELLSHRVLQEEVGKLALSQAWLVFLLLKVLLSLSVGSHPSELGL